MPDLAGPAHAAHAAPDALSPDTRARVEEFRRRHRTSLVTLLFTDLVGSTRLKQERGDLEAVALMQAHAAMVREILAGVPEAEEISTAGDAFFCVFVRPSDAVRFALQVQAAMRTQFGWHGQLAARAPGDSPGAQADEPPRARADEPPVPPTAPPPAIEIRIGIHLGEVVVEDRTGESKPRDLFGLQVDTAARVQSLAEGGQILLTRSVFDNARQVLKGSLAWGGTGGLPARAERESHPGREPHPGTGSKLPVPPAPLVWLNHGPWLVKGVEDPIEICEVGEEGLAPLRRPGPSEKAHPVDMSEEELGWRPAPEIKVPGTAWVLEGKLGEGGFGEVWRARHPQTKESRVFKFCFHKERLRTLRRELALFRLLREKVGDHPNIVRLYDVFFDTPPYYLSMEDVPGRNLREWLEGAPSGRVPRTESGRVPISSLQDGLPTEQDSRRESGSGASGDRSVGASQPQSHATHWNRRDLSRPMRSGPARGPADCTRFPPAPNSISPPRWPTPSPPPRRPASSTRT